MLQDAEGCWWCRKWPSSSRLWWQLESFRFLPTSTDQELSQSNGSKGWVSEAQRPIRASDYSNLQQVECQYQHYLLVSFCRTLPILSDPSGPSRFEQLTRHQSLLNASPKQPVGSITLNNQFEHFCLSSCPISQLIIPWSTSSNLRISAQRSTTFLQLFQVGLFSSSLSIKSWRHFFI